MPGLVPTASVALPARRYPRILLPGLALIAGLAFLLVMASIAVVTGLKPVTLGAEPSGLARGEIPSVYLRLYREIGERYGLDPWILAGIGYVETQHGQSAAPGVRSGVNAFGCCAGPMQISLAGSPSTWERFRVDGDGDGRMSVYAPADAIATAARYLKASGAPADYHAALFAYNHAEWYVAQVLAKADEYRGAATGELAAAPDGVAPAAESMRAILANRRITLTPIQRTDVRTAVLDARLLAVLAWTGEHHSVVITALTSDHSRTTVDGNISNHSVGSGNGHRRGRRGDLPRHSRRPLRRPGARIRRDAGAAALDGADLLLGSGRAGGSARIRARGSLRPHPRGMGRLSMAERLLVRSAGGHALLAAELVDRGVDFPRMRRRHVPLGVLLAVGGDPLDLLAAAVVDRLLSPECEDQRAALHVEAPFDDVHGVGLPGFARCYVPGWSRNPGGAGTYPAHQRSRRRLSRAVGPYPERSERVNTRRSAELAVLERSHPPKPWPRTVSVTRMAARRAGRVAEASDPQPVGASGRDVVVRWHGGGGGGVRGRLFGGLAAAGLGAVLDGDVVDLKC